MSKPLPSHIVFAVHDRTDPTYWVEIGTLWPHQDGLGFDAKFTTVPAYGSDIIIRSTTPSTTPTKEFIHD